MSCKYDYAPTRVCIRGVLDGEKMWDASIAGRAYLDEEKHIIEAVVRSVHAKVTRDYLPHVPGVQRGVAHLVR